MMFDIFILLLNIALTVLIIAQFFSSEGFDTGVQYDSWAREVMPGCGHQ